MNSVLITIGDEILIGQVVDTNSVWISQQLNLLGVRVKEMIAVADEAEQIKGALDRYIGRYDLLIMTGGLGPTRDDITKLTLASYFGSRMVTHPEVLNRITSYFRERGRNIIDSNLRQADVPEACRVLMNNHGTAPGMWFEKEGSIVISLPGVPYEMKGLMNDHVLPAIRDRVEVPEVVHKTIMTQGVPESYLAAMLRDWEASLPACVKLAYLPRPGIVRLRLTVTGECAPESEQILKVILDKLQKIIPEHIFGFDETDLEDALGQLLVEKGMTLATAESCTGGNIARLITSVPGSSRYFNGSVVAYENRIKHELLQVKEKTLESSGAVSREVVEQMARGAQQRFHADAAIATSGIAGPDGGSEEKPVGTTWISVVAGEKIHSVQFRFGGNRERIIDQASYSAMQMLRRLILGLL